MCISNDARQDILEYIEYLKNELGIINATIVFNQDEVVINYTSETKK